MPSCRPLPLLHAVEKSNISQHNYVVDYVKSVLAVNPFRRCCRRAREIVSRSSDGLYDTSPRRVPSVFDDDGYSIPLVDEDNLHYRIGRLHPRLGGWLTVSRNPGCLHLGFRVHGR